MADAFQDVVARRDHERAEADREYDRALAALDRILRDPPDVPGTPPPYEKQQLAALNRAWDVLPARSLLDRVRNALARVLVPAVSRQAAFNSALVDYLNRTAETNREGRSALIQFLQTVSPFVGARSHVAETALDGLTTDWLKRWDSLTLREARFVDRLAALDDLRSTLGVVQQMTFGLKRELQSAEPRAPRPAGGPIDAPAATAAAPDLDAYKYVGFEDRFRGSRELIRERLLTYVPLFEGPGVVLDAGCGRGELLDLFRERGVAARGIDVNDEMVTLCRARGLDADRGDAVGYLSAQADGSLGGLIAIQVVEHLDPAYLLRFIDLAGQKLRPGAPLVLETINPACWLAFFESYVRDITHVRPLHPETLQYFVQASGFSRTEVRFSAPVAEHQRLEAVRLATAAAVQPADLAAVIEAFNANVERLNARLFTHMDYAIVAWR